MIPKGLNLGVGILNGGFLLFQLNFKDGTDILRLTELLRDALHFDMIIIQLLELLLNLPILGLDFFAGLCPQPLIQALQLIQGNLVSLAVTSGILELHRHGLVGFLHFLELSSKAVELTGGPLLELLLKLFNVLPQLSVLIGELLVKDGKLLQLRVM